MKWLVIALILVATSSVAANITETLKLKNGVTFHHQAHQTYLKTDCKNCHRKAGQAPGKIDGFGKDVAHRMCRTCHAMRNMGPVSCKDCHTH